MSEKTGLGKILVQAGNPYQSINVGESNWLSDLWGTTGTTTVNPVTGLTTKTKGTGLQGFLGSDSVEGLGTLTGIGTDIWGISNTLKAQKQANKQWEAENSRANEIMAMNREKYDTYKADKSRLNSQYA